MFILGSAIGSCSLSILYLDTLQGFSKLYNCIIQCIFQQNLIYHNDLKYH
jgi:hypothetical protein